MGVYSPPLSRIRYWAICPTCDGGQAAPQTGWGYDDATAKCPQCGGKGQILVPYQQAREEVRQSGDEVSEKAGDEQVSSERSGETEAGEGRKEGQEG